MTGLAFAATDASLAEVAQELCAGRSCAISCEPFIQWSWKITLSPDARSGKWQACRWCRTFCRGEQMKLRMLNGSHSLLPRAYLGHLPGMRTLMNVWRMRRFVRPRGG
ncbi:hypothetical protein KIF59_07315 [Enterobacter cloacae subsp. cloacae]|nr:hypothetical protein [Enterobacter cloacae subsp. cloacae]